MLNLSPIFDDAIEAICEHGRFLVIAPLPAAVFLLQCDVINHYRFALTHYFGLSLDEPFLQNSSIGTPYQKWAKFTNDDFELLSFTTHNLIRYTSRLIDESHCKALEAAKQFREMKSLSNCYTNAICDIHNKQRRIGIRINDDETLTVTPFANGPLIDGSVHVTSTFGGPTYRYHTTIDNNGNESTIEITQERYEELMRTLREEMHDIRDRSVVHHFKEQGLSELKLLADRNKLFADTCRRYYSTTDPITPFDARHQSWCV